MNSFITCSLEARSMIMAVVLKKLLRTAMNIVPEASSLSMENKLAIQSFSSENLISEYVRRYGEVQFYNENGWNSEIISLIEDVIEAQGEKNTNSILQMCEAIVDGRDIEKKGVFAELFSGFPLHIFLGSKSFSPEHGA